MYGVIHIRQYQQKTNSYEYSSLIEIFSCDNTGNPMINTLVYLILLIIQHEIVLKEGESGKGSGGLFNQIYRTVVGY